MREPELTQFAMTESERQTHILIKKQEELVTVKLELKLELEILLRL